MGAWFAVVTAGRVNICDVALAKSCHLNDIARIAAKSPTGFGKHYVFKLLSFSFIGYIVGQHNKLEILRYLPATVVSSTARRTIGYITIVICLGLCIDAGLQILIEFAVVAGLRTGEVSCCSPILTERYFAGIELVGYTNAKESLFALAKE